MSDKKVIGILGGMGPAATADLFTKIINNTEAGCDQDHLHVIIDSNTNIPDRTEALIHGGADPTEPMTQSARRLAEAGAELIVMPCNTAHYFYDELEQAVEIPVVNIVEETIRYAKARVQDLSCVGIMATTGTIVTGTYQKYAERAGLSFAVPDEDEQDLLMQIIYDGVKAGKPVPRADFDRVANHLRAKGAQCLILGCTELSVLKRDLPINDPDVLDSIDVLASETVRRSGKPFTDECLLC